MSTVQRYFIFSLFFYINYITRKIIVYIFFCSLSNIVYYINLNYSRASFLSFLDKYNLFIFFSDLESFLVPFIFIQSIPIPKYVLLKNSTKGVIKFI